MTLISTCEWAISLQKEPPQGGPCPDQTESHGLPQEPRKMYVLGSLIFRAICRARYTATSSATWAEPGVPSSTRDMLPAG